MNYFISLGVDVNTQNNWGATPLFLASRQNPNVEVVGFLVFRGADVNLGIWNGETSLHTANTEEKRVILRAAGGRSGQ